MSNLYAQFRKLLPDPPLQAGTVASTSDGIVVVTLPGGGQIQARGAGTIGNNVFVRDGVIEGDAPSLTVLDITV